MEISIDLPENVKFIMDQLLSKGYDAYLVGGTVRDLLMKKLGIETKYPDDMDITTNAKPDEIKEVYKKFRIFTLGERHGTISVRYKRKSYDITTYRIDGEYVDGRRPDKVKFVDNLVDDLARRDLTINAMAADIEGRIIDPFSGINDIKQGIIRTVGNPNKRIEEDALRLLRAVRFATKFQFKIEEVTFDAIKKRAEYIIHKSVSPERIYTEVSKIFETNAALGLILLYDSVLFKYIFPDVYLALEAQYDSDVHLQYLRGVKEVPTSLVWPYLFSPLVLQTSLSFKKLEKILSRYKGMKKSDRKHYANLLTHVYRGIELISSDVNQGEIFRFILRTRKIYGHVKTEYWVQTPSDAIQLSNAVYQGLRLKKPPYIDYVTSRIRWFMENYDNRKKLVNGDDAKTLGARNGAIRSLLQLWDNLYYRDISITREQLLNVGIALKEKHSLDAACYLTNFCSGSFQGTQSEINDLRKEIRLIHNLLKFFGGLVIISTDEEYHDLFNIPEYDNQASGIYIGDEKFSKFVLN